MKRMKKIMIVMLAALTLTTGMALGNPKPTEQAMEKLEIQVIKKIDHISKKANNTKSDNEKNLKGFVLSTQIKTFNDIQKNIDIEIEDMKSNMKLLIGEIALDIEIHGVNKIGSLNMDKMGRVFYIPNPNLPKKLNAKRKKLLAASLKNRVTVRSAYLALNLLANVNNKIMVLAKATKNKKDKEQLYMKQAIYVYEMADIVLDLLEELTLDGSEDIHTLHDGAKARVKANIFSINEQKGKAKRLAKKKLITPVELKDELNGLTLIIKANERSLKGWENILGKIGTQEDFLTKLKSRKDLISYKKDKAKIQIETLRDLRGVAILKDSIGTMDDLTGLIDQLNLLVLDEQTVTELLGGYEFDAS